MLWFLEWLHISNKLLCPPCSSSDVRLNPMRLGSVDYVLSIFDADRSVRSYEGA